MTSQNLYLPEKHLHLLGLTHSPLKLQLLTPEQSILLSVNTGVIFTISKELSR